MLRFEQCAVTSLYKRQSAHQLSEVHYPLSVRYLKQ